MKLRDHAIEEITLNRDGTVLRHPRGPFDVIPLRGVPIEIFAGSPVVRIKNCMILKLDIKSLKGERKFLFCHKNYNTDINIYICVYDTYVCA